MVDTKRPIDSDPENKSSAKKAKKEKNEKKEKKRKEERRQDADEEGAWALYLLRIQDWGLKTGSQCLLQALQKIWGLQAVSSGKAKASQADISFSATRRWRP